MRYPNLHRATFLARPNRFIAQVELAGAVETVHVKNTGRCRELLLPGSTVYLVESDNPARKTRWDLVAVEKIRAGAPPLLINMDAQAPNKAFQEWAEGGGFLPALTLLRPETTWGKSRFDFYWEAGPRRGFVEVKGVTLESGGHAKFPDAPTERGVKHLDELVKCRSEGYEPYLCFLLQMAGMTDFSPNDQTHPAFGDALRRAAEAGVAILARCCDVAPDSMAVAGPVRILL